MSTNHPSRHASPSLDRRRFLAAGAATVAGAGAVTAGAATPDPDAAKVVRPPADKRFQLGCKLTMIPAASPGESLVDRLRRAGAAGFDGVDLDLAGNYTPEEARAAVAESGVFVHNAITNEHWHQRLTDPDPAVRATGRKNAEHCLRVSHAAGGSGILLVVGVGADGPEDVIVERCRQEIKQLIPLAAALGQMILIENVWNRMFYDQDAPPEQGPERFIEFIDSFASPWVGLYYDIGNHWKYGQPAEWIRQLGRRCVKLDLKGFSRAEDKWTEITAGDLPWAEVRQALDDIGFAGWATAEVPGGDLARLTEIRQQMQEALAI